jgi:ATP-dependent helicase Lhr and Lhr-like helicase
MWGAVMPTASCASSACVVRVEDAHGQPPTIPFWLGEAPGRSDDLSASVSRLRETVAARLRLDASGESGRRLLTNDAGVAGPAAEQLIEYLAASFAALECLPTQDTLVFERFFDEAGGMQLVIHSPFGSRINRAWGLAFRKRFCRRFNFELQAAATEDNIVLSLTTTHSFELEEVAGYLHSTNVRSLLIQAVLDAPMFATRWRRVVGWHSHCRGFAADGRWRRSWRAWKPRTWSPPFSPTRWPVARTLREIAKFPTTR